MSKVVGDHILVSNFIRYERLTELINKEFYNSNCNSIKLVIDAYSMIKSIYGLQPTDFLDEFSIASCIINACAHYRNFFWTRYRVTCSIWVVFSKMELSGIEARQFDMNYKTIFDAPNPVLSEMIEKNLSIVDTLCPYLPDIKFIYSGYEPYLSLSQICNYGAREPIFMVTKDIIPLMAITRIPDMYILRPIKKNGEDLSLLITPRNALQYYLSVRKIEYNTNPLLDIYLPFIMSATRLPERGFKSIHNINQILKYIDTALNKNYISASQVYDIKGLCDSLKQANNVDLKEYEITLRYNAIGYDACVNRYLNSYTKDDVRISNLHDPDSVKLINEKYFNKVPLDLMSL